LLCKYKKQIAKAYLLPNPKERSTNINVNKLINQFKKICIYERELADLMLYRVECGVEAFRRDDKRSATFYNCIVVSFEDAIKLIVTDSSIAEFKQRINRIIKDSVKGKYEVEERMGNIVQQYLY
jgi:hypothetical protein